MGVRDCLCDSSGLFQSSLGNHKPTGKQNEKITKTITYDYSIRHDQIKPDIPLKFAYNVLTALSNHKSGQSKPNTRPKYPQSSPLKELLIKALSYLTFHYRLAHLAIPLSPIKLGFRVAAEPAFTVPIRWASWPTAK